MELNKTTNTEKQKNIKMVEHETQISFFKRRDFRYFMKLLRDRGAIIYYATGTYSEGKDFYMHVTIKHSSPQIVESVVKFYINKNRTFNRKSFWFWLKPFVKI